MPPVYLCLCSPLVFEVKLVGIFGKTDLSSMSSLRLHFTHVTIFLHIASPLIEKKENRKFFSATGACAEQ